MDGALKNSRRKCLQDRKKSAVWSALWIGISKSTAGDVAKARKIEAHDVSELLPARGDQPQLTGVAGVPVASGDRMMRSDL